MKDQYGSEIDFTKREGISHDIKVCHGLSCGQKNPETLLQAIKGRYQHRQDIDISVCYCFGQCKRGSNIAIDGEVINFVTIQGLDSLLKKHVDRPDDLKKAGLTAQDLDSILFGSNS